MVYVLKKLLACDSGNLCLPSHARIKGLGDPNRISTLELLPCHYAPASSVLQSHEAICEECLEGYQLFLAHQAPSYRTAKTQNSRLRLLGMRRMSKIKPFSRNRMERLA